MRDLADLALSAQRAADALPAAQRRGVQKAALHTVRIVRGEIRAVTGDMKLSGVGVSGARVGARYDVKGTTDPTALIRATGPLHFVEHPVRAHEIRPRKRRGTKALKLPGGRFAARVMWRPRAAPRRPFAHGVAKAAPATGAIFHEQIAGAIGRAWI